MKTAVAIQWNHVFRVWISRSSMLYMKLHMRMRGCVFSPVDTGATELYQFANNCCSYVNSQSVSLSERVSCKCTRHQRERQKRRLDNQINMGKGGPQKANSKHRVCRYNVRRLKQHCNRLSIGNWFTIRRKYRNFNEILVGAPTK